MSLASFAFQACLIDRSSISPFNQQFARGPKECSAKPSFTNIDMSHAANHLSRRARYRRSQLCQTF